MSSIRLKEAVINKLKANASLTALLPTGTGKTHIGQYLSDVKDRLPYVSVHVQRSNPRSSTVNVIHKTVVRITTYGAAHTGGSLMPEQLLDSIIEDITDTSNDFWDVSNSYINNAWTELLVSDMVNENDFEEHSDIHSRSLDVQLTWRIACDSDTSVDIEAAEPVSDPRDPDGDIC